MRRSSLTALTLALALPLASAHAEEPIGTKFWGAVQVDADHIVSYYITVPPGQKSTLTMDSGYRLEFESAPAGSTPGPVSIKLFDKSRKALHERSDQGNSPMNLSGSYAVCRGNVVFISPAPTEVPTCDDE